MSIILNYIEELPEDWFSGKDDGVWPAPDEEDGFGSLKRPERHFSLNRCITSQKFGTNNVPIKPFIAMPNTTAVPSSMRLLAPAPLANIIGITPKTNARAVIMIGRNLITPASCAA